MRNVAHLLGGIAAMGLAAPVAAQSTAPNQPSAPPQSASATRASANPQTVPPDAARDGGIADIVVTAQKRSENLQSTPLAITALNADTIKDKGIASAADLTAIAPSVSVTISPASATNMQLFIRGIGDVDPILTSDSPVGLYVDGVILGRASGSAFDILDLERIEVLRGPQGTLYGRNTIGGAVNLITVKPSQDFHAELDAGGGNLGFYQVRTSVDTGDIAKSGLTARFTYLHKQRNGFVDDPDSRDNRDPGAYVLDAVRAALRFRRGPLTLDYGFDYSDRSGYAAAFQLTAVRPDVLAYLQASPKLGGGTPNVSPNRLDRVFLNQGVMTDRVMGHTVTADLDLGGVTLRSLTGFRQWRNRNAGDDLGGNANLVGFTVSPAILAPPNPFLPLGVTPLTLFATQNVRRQHQFSQEFNILGRVGDHFDYVIGGYYFSEHSYERNPQNFLLALPSPVAIPLTPTLQINSFGVQLGSLYDYDHFNESKAGFVQGTYKVTSTLSVTGGVRYTDDSKRLEQRAPLTRTLNASFNRVNYSASIDWQATPTTLLYARTATGYKAGGFNARSVNSGYKPEALTSYEAGLKTDLFDRRLRLNLASFYATHTDLQLQQLQAGTGGASSITVNAGKARYWGLEAEITARPVDGVTVGSNIGYTNRKYLQFLILDPTTNRIVDVKDTARFQVGATTTISAFAQWDIAQLAIGKLSARLDYDYRGRIYFNPTTVGTPYNEVISGAPRSLFNARVALADIDLHGAKAELAVWGKNVFDQKYRLYGIDFGGLGFAGNTYAEPATYGIDFRIKL
ncbi:TonB-dependent receptor [Sphingomonas sp. TDK1]|uniref:TonB-dependent receptor n=1 Tax=Sphingomonas sp. TDK1 TaxID=453247 RepID=UPI000AF0B3DC|nr:TonB-dependent receptor [Sphingomonas sp. TDK1]